MSDLPAVLLSEAPTLSEPGSNKLGKAGFPGRPWDSPSRASLVCTTMPAFYVGAGDRTQVPMLVQQAFSLPICLPNLV